MGIRVRRATREDVKTLLQLIHELSIYERLENEVSATEEDLEETLFGNRPYAEAFLGEIGGKTEGFALFFHNYSTFLGKPGLYLEDLYVRELSRGQGLGWALFQAVAKTAQERKCGRLEWSVLNWNKPAIEFYEKCGAKRLEEWSTYRLTGKALAAIAENGSKEN